jgi:hypothetical protein
MKHCFHILVLAIVALMAACTTQTDVPQVIDDAEHLVSDGNYADAVSMCDRLVTTDDSARLTAGQLCRIGAIYAIAADNDIDNEANIARAMHSFGNAYKMNRDSVTAYVDHLALDRLTAVRTVLQLLRYQNSDLSNFEDFEDFASSQLEEIGTALDKIGDNE